MISQKNPGAPDHLGVTSKKIWDLVIYKAGEPGRQVLLQTALELSLIHI